jgi:simple sugar transport system ATP-binding protein
MSKEVPLVKMENISKWFGKVCALNSVDFEISEGEMIGIVGGNGAGKSTLIKILSGVIKQDKGEIYYRGENVKNLSVKKMRELGIETVFQEQALIDCFDVGRNIFLAREPVFKIGPIEIVNYKEIYKRSLKPIEELGLNLSPRTEVQYCSGGERQGVAISRAMEFKAKVIILDEPTRNLSIKGVNQVNSFIEKLKKDKIAVVFITHDIRHVFSLADKFVILSRGKKVIELEKRDLTVEGLENMILKDSV